MHLRVKRSCSWHSRASMWIDIGHQPLHRLHLLGLHTRMPPRSMTVPRGTFASHAKHLRHQQRRSASTAVSQLPTAAAIPDAPLWRSRTEPLTRLGQSITGAMEWQTSTYSFNKQAVKPIPVVTTNVEKLIHNYVTMKRVNNEGKDVRAIRTALAARRKSAEKVYVSKPKSRTMAIE